MKRLLLVIGLIGFSCGCCSSYRNGYAATQAPRIPRQPPMPLDPCIPRRSIRAGRGCAGLRLSAGYFVSGRSAGRLLYAGAVLPVTLPAIV